MLRQQQAMIAIDAIGSGLDMGGGGGECRRATGDARAWRSGFK